jgi:hypothetical protein
MQFAILEQLKKPSFVFKDVIEQHFNIKKHKVVKQLKKWVQEDKSLVYFLNEIKIKLGIQIDQNEFIVEESSLKNDKNENDNNNIDYNIDETNAINNDNNNYFNKYNTSSPHHFFYHNNFNTSLAESNNNIATVSKTNTINNSENGKNDVTPNNMNNTSSNSNNYNFDSNFDHFNDDFVDYSYLENNTGNNNLNYDDYDYELNMAILNNTKDFVQFNSD